MISQKINIITSKLSELTEIVRSVILLGSHSTDNTNRYSDIDILIITHAEISPENASIIGDKISDARANDEPNSFFNFYNPVCERCKFISTITYRFHFITHSWGNIEKWLREKEFISCMWAYKSTVLWGDNPFAKNIVPELNKSILDGFDGIPGFVREINNILITKNPLEDAHEFERYCKFFMDRIAEIERYFPEISRCSKAPVRPKGKRGLVQLSNYFTSIQCEIHSYLIQSSNKKIQRTQKAAPLI